MNNRRSFFFGVKRRESRLAKSKTPLEQAASKILERRNQSETDWKKGVIEKAQLDFFRGKDKDLEEYVLDRERQALVYKEIIK